jgi:hypothetical protein
MINGCLPDNMNAASTRNGPARMFRKSRINTRTHTSHLIIYVTDPEFQQVVLSGDVVCASMVAASARTPYRSGGRPEGCDKKVLLDPISDTTFPGRYVSCLPVFLPFK